MDQDKAEQNLGVQRDQSKATSELSAEFTPGQKVKCVDAQMEGCGPCLDEGRIYTVREFVPPSECSPSHHEWEKNGGRMELEEPPHGGFYGRRFRAA